MVTINLRVSPVEKFNHTFAFTGVNGPQLGPLRDSLLRAPVAPVAIDYVNASAADKMRLEGPTLLARFACQPAVVNRIRVHLAKEDLVLPEPLAEEPAFYIWQRVREWLNTRAQGHADGVVLQMATSNSRIFHDANAMGGQVVARAGSGGYLRRIPRQRYRFGYAAVSGNAGPPRGGAPGPATHQGAAHPLGRRPDRSTYDAQAERLF